MIVIFSITLVYIALIYFVVFYDDVWNYVFPKIKSLVCFIIQAKKTITGPFLLWLNNDSQHTWSVIAKIKNWKQHRKNKKAGTIDANYFVPVENNKRNFKFLNK